MDNSQEVLARIDETAYSTIKEAAAKGATPDQMLALVFALQAYRVQHEPETLKWLT